MHKGSNFRRQEITRHVRRGETVVSLRKNFNLPEYHLRLAEREISVAIGLVLNAQQDGFHKWQDTTAGEMIPQQMSQYQMSI